MSGESPAQIIVGLDIADMFGSQIFNRALLMIYFRRVPT